MNDIDNINVKLTLLQVLKFTLLKTIKKMVPYMLSQELKDACS